MISYNEAFRDFQSYPPTTIITNYHQFHVVIILYTSFRWKNMRFLCAMNESCIFQLVLCHIGFSYPLFLQTWCSVICTGCICQKSAIQLSSWQSFSKYRREMKKENIEERMNRIPNRLCPLGEWLWLLFNKQFKCYHCVILVLSADCENSNKECMKQPQEKIINMKYETTLKWCSLLPSTIMQKIRNF